MVSDFTQIPTQNWRATHPWLIIAATRKNISIQIGYLGPIKFFQEVLAGMIQAWQAIQLGAEELGAI